MIFLIIVMVLTLTVAAGVVAYVAYPHSNKPMPRIARLLTRLDKSFERFQVLDAEQARAEFTKLREHKSP